MKIFILAIFVCSSVFASDKLKQVKDGMTKEEVVNILGRPDEVHVDEKNETTYLYDKFLVGFKQDKVYEVFDHGI
jgi:hypothetical protein